MDLPTLWRSQLIATVKKNVELRTSRTMILIYLIPFVILTGVLILLTVISAIYDITFWDPYNNTMGGIVFLYYIMSLPSLVTMGKEKEAGTRDIMLRVSGSNNNSRRACITLFYFSLPLLLEVYIVLLTVITLLLKSSLSLDSHGGSTSSVGLSLMG